MLARSIVLGTLGILVAGGQTVLAGRNVAVVDSGECSPTACGQHWCDFLVEHGHTCAVFPKEGPTSSLDPFEVVIDLSGVWADPGGILPDVLHREGTLIIVDFAANALGLDADPTVQAWLGADEYATEGGDVVSVAKDPILGSHPPGTLITICNAFPCGSLISTTTHAQAKVLARFQNSLAEIGLQRNDWEGGVAIYMTYFIDPGVGFQLHDQIILNAVAARPPQIPAISEWGMLALMLGVVAGGVAILWRRARGAHRHGVARLARRRHVPESPPVRGGSWEWFARLSPWAAAPVVYTQS